MHLCTAYGGAVDRCEQGMSRGRGFAPSPWIVFSAVSAQQRNDLLPYRYSVLLVNRTGRKDSCAFDRKADRHRRSFSLYFTGKNDTIIT